MDTIHNTIERNICNGDLRLHPKNNNILKTEKVFYAPLLFLLKTRLLVIWGKQKAYAGNSYVRKWNLWKNFQYH